MAKTKTPVQPKIVYRDQIESDHHLFKGKIAKCLKSDKFGPIKLKQVEHVHFFHTINSDGTEQKQTAAVAGHIHEVDWNIDEDGNLVAKCGPPLRKIVRPGPGGAPRATWERIKVKNHDDNTWLEDNHTHEMTYMGSEKMSHQKVQAIQENNAKKLGSMIRPGDVRVHADPGQVEGFSMGDADSKRETT